MNDIEEQKLLYWKFRINKYWIIQVAEKQKQYISDNGKNLRKKTVKKITVGKTVKFRSSTEKGPVPIKY